MNELLNNLPTANDTQIKNWIKHQESFEDDGVDDGEWRSVDWDSFQALFSDSAKKTIEKSIVEQEIEEALSFDRLCRTVSDYVINCAYVIKNMSEGKGFAFFKLAKCLHICDYTIRNFEPDIFALDEIPKRSTWSEYIKEINAICELINYKTDNINVLIEKLLLLSWESGYDAAAVALENTYTNKWIYEDIFKEWNEYKFFPWFDITCMDKDFDSLNIEFDFENYKKIDNETIRVYAKKAFVILFNDKTKISKDLEKCLIEFYRFALDVLGKDFIDTEIPYIQKKANDGITEYKKLIVDYKNKQVFEMKIEELGLSTQTYSLLRRANFHTIGDIVGKSKSKFLTIKRFGNGRLNELIESLNKYNLSLPD